MERLERHSSSPWGTSWREMLAALRRALCCLGFFAASTRWRAPAPRCWVPGKPCHSGRLWPGKQQPDPGLQTSWSCSGNCKRRERRTRTWSLVIYLSVQFGEAEIFPFVTGAFFLLCSCSTTEVWPTHSCHWDTNFHTSPSQASSRKSKAKSVPGRRKENRQQKWEVWVTSVILMISPELRHSFLLSSSTVFMFSIHKASTGPSNMYHFLMVSAAAAPCRMSEERIPSVLEGRRKAWLGSFWFCWNQWQSFHHTRQQSQNLTLVHVSKDTCASLLDELHKGPSHSFFYWDIRLSLSDTMRQFLLALGSGLHGLQL